MRGHMKRRNFLGMVAAMIGSSMSAFWVTAPRKWSVRRRVPAVSKGELITADSWNEQIRENMQIIKTPRSGIL